MEFDKSRIYTAFNADDLAIGSICIFGFTVADLEKWETVGDFLDGDLENWEKANEILNISKVSEILPKDIACRFGAKDGMEYALAYQICPPENAVAFIEEKKGLDIEIFDEKEKVWRKTSSPSEADFFKFKFRVAADNFEYIAYKDTNELIDDWKSKIGWKARTSEIANLTLPIIWIRDKVNKVRYSVLAFNDTSVACFLKVYSMEDLLKDFEFLDGSPCGVAIA